MDEHLLSFLMTKHFKYNLGGEENNFHSTDDGKTSEKSHGASNC